VRRGYHCCSSWLGRVAGIRGRTREGCPKRPALGPSGTATKDAKVQLPVRPTEEFRSNKTIVEGLPLNRLVGPDGLMVLLSLVAEAELPHAEIVELMKRVQIPGYELVRNLTLRGQRSKLLVPILGPRCYLQSEIREMLASGA
jgi:hypothetical protein